MSETILYQVAETFLTINGEGTRAGQLAFFVRFVGCNLRCSYCDTMWANQPDAAYTAMSADDILALARESGAKNITVTGGEPLLQENIGELLTALAKEFFVEVETNGAMPLAELVTLNPRPSFTMDYKLPSSGMEAFMCLDNLSLLTKADTLKFVCGSEADFMRAVDIIRTYELNDRTHVYLSPVFGQIDPAAMVELMKTHGLNDVTLQLQMHKLIWDPNARGV